EQQNSDSPFFLYLSHNMPHAPIFASPAFQGRSEGGRYGDVIEELDWSVGQVLHTLKKKDMEKDTLVIFTSDNGPWTMFGPHGGTALPLRGEKGTSWEGGFRVPGIFYWPGTIAPAQIGDVAANLDLYATFAALAGGQEPLRKPGYRSLDLTPALLEGKPSPRTKWLFGRAAFRSGDYKIHRTSKIRSSDPDTRKREPTTSHEPPLLFNVREDMGETKNLTAQHPELTERLLAEMEAF
ncbi:MAG: sulfatase-like hydrolase/transferase, partial [Verrucomicrobiota bacterium]